MDPVTHTLLGAVMGEGLFRRKVGPEALPVMLIASNLPDIDVAVHFTGDPAAITMRRTFGHSALLLPLWSLLLAWLFKRRWPHLRLGTLFGMCLLGASGHVLFDLINSFGVRLLWPLSPWRPELAMVFIIDLVLTGLLAAPFLLCSAERTRPWRQRACRLALACAAAYLLVCAGGRRLAAAALARETAGSSPEFTYVFPEPLGPHRWRGVALEDDAYRVYLLKSLAGTAELRERVPTDLQDPAVLAARRTPLAGRLEAFFKAPVWRADPAGARVWDLRFTSLVLGRDNPFEFRIK